MVSPEAFNMIEYFTVVQNSIFFQNKVNGLTKSFNFDGFGRRNDVIIDVLELTPAGNQTVSNSSMALNTTAH